MVRRDNPCHNCERRTAVCRLDCQDWKDYTDKRDAAYSKEPSEVGLYRYEMTRMLRIHKEKERHKRK